MQALAYYKVRHFHMIRVAKGAVTWLRQQATEALGFDAWLTRQSLSVVAFQRRNFCHSSRA